MVSYLSNDKMMKMIVMMKRQVTMNGVMVSSRHRRLLKFKKNSSGKQKEAAVIAKPKKKNLTIIIIIIITTRKTGLIHTKSTSIENDAAVGQVIVVWTQDSQFLLKMVRTQRTVPVYDLVVYLFYLQCSVHNRVSFV